MTSLPHDWNDPAWVGAAHGWIGTQLAQRGWALAGPVEQIHVRPWSTVLRVPTSEGLLYFKANVPALGHEAGVLRVLDACCAGLVPPIVALDPDPEHTWMLMRHAGDPLAERESHVSPYRWQEFMAAYGRLQVAAQGSAGELMRAGTPDMRPHRLADELAALLADPDATRVGTPEGLSTEELSTLRELQPVVAEALGELEASGIRPTIQHDDLHQGNMLVAGLERFVFVDWSDSVVAHPFASIVLPLMNIAGEHRLSGPFDPALEGVRHAYLAAWEAHGSPASLERLLRPATVAAALHRAVVWRKIELDVPHLRHELPTSAAAWLRRLIGFTQG